MKKITSIILAIVLVLNISIVGSAEEFTPLMNSESSTLEEISEFLDDSKTTQIIEVSEKEMIEEMLYNKSITKEDLNEEFTKLSKETTVSLREKGYNEKQIDVIRSYKEGDDAFAHAFNSKARSASNATVQFRYGLAGTNTRKTIKIAYDIRWSECPLFTFTDSFGIAWIAADSNSHEVVTKTDSSTAQVNYYNPGTEQYANSYRTVSMNTSANGVVTGNPIIGSANGNYGKHIGGVTQVSSQSDSYNIETIHVFVAYAHSKVTITPTANVTIGWNRVNATISFNAKKDQSIKAQGDHTFRYNDNGEITA